ncbi:putative ribonuclease H-like domain-containing protein, partial [Tanacetum coccineum]
CLHTQTSNLNEHQLKFNSIKDAKKLLEAVEKRFGRNEATKKTQRNLLKQQYENFTAPSSEMLDQTFDRLQKLVSQLELLGEKISQEHVNQKLLRSLSPEWNTHAVMWRNKDDFDTMSIDDLYNNLNVYEPEFKGMSSSSSSTQNIAFVSSSNNNTCSTNKAVNTAHGVSTTSTQVNAANSTNINNLSDVVIYFVTQPNSPQFVHEDLPQTHPNDMEEMDLRWQMSILTIVGRSPKWSATTATRGDILLGSVELQEIKTTRSRKAQEGVLPVGISTSTALVYVMVLWIMSDEFVNKPVVENCKAMSSKEEPKLVRPGIVKKEFVKSKQQEKTARKIVKQVEQHRKNTHSLRGNQRNWNNIMSPKLGSNFEMFNKACYVCGSFDNLQDQGVIDSGCSRHMTWNMSYLTNYEEIDGGYVAFGGNPKGGKITGIKDETNGILKSFITGIENLVDHKVKCSYNSSKMELLRGDRTLIEAARTMLADSKLPTTFWAEAVNTACYVQNRVLVVKPHNKTPYKLFHGTQSNGFVGTKASDNAGQARKETEPVKDYIFLPLWTADPPYSQDSKSSHDDGFKPSSDNGKKVNEDLRKNSESKNQEKEDNYSTNTVNTASTNEVNAVSRKTSIKLPFDPNMPALDDYNIFDFSRNDEDDGAEADKNNLDITIQVSPILTTIIYKDHPLVSDWDLQSVLKQKRCQEEPKKVIHALKVKLDKGYARRAFTIQVTRSLDFRGMYQWKRVIGSNGLFLAYALFKDFVVYQMDVKSAFLYGKIEEEVYVCQPPRFEDPDFLDRVYKVEKALYGLHQAPRAWYETLSTYMLDNGFQRGKIDKTLFIKRHKGELTFFLGLQVKQKKDGIFISQDKYVDEILKKFGFTEVKTASTPMETQKPLLKDEDGEEVDVHMYRSMIGSLMYLTSLRPDIMFAVCACARYQVNPKVSHLYAVKRIFRYLKGQPKLGLWYLKDYLFDLVAYTDSDYVGASLDRKSTIGGCQFLGCRLISWQCKK